MIAVEVSAHRHDFDCANCSQKNDRGHFCDDSNPAPFATWIIPGLIESKICLLPMVTAFSWEMLRLYPFWDKGVMPFPGSFYQQPQIIVEAMRVIDNARVKLKREADGAT